MNGVSWFPETVPFTKIQKYNDFIVWVSRGSPLGRSASEFSIGSECIVR